MKQNQHQMITSGSSQELVEEEVSLMAQIETRDKHEEILWRQKSRVLWLQEGERNSKFFHNSMIQRRHQNIIISLKDQQGNKLSNHQDIQSELLQYYITLMQEPQLNRKEAIRKITQHIPKMINENHNEALMRPVTMEEVEQVIWEMPKGKSPGPDGFTVDFYQACWLVIKNEVWEVVEDSRKYKKFLPAFNATFLTLIPKEDKVENPNKFCPISLCNVIYKLISKIIANRLKPLLPSLISPEQTGFVEGRQILDSIILTHDLIHSLHSSKKPECSSN
jgi:hypothetical protein